MKNEEPWWQTVQSYLYQLVMNPDLNLQVGMSIAILYIVKTKKSGVSRCSQLLSLCKANAFRIELHQEVTQASPTSWCFFSVGAKLQGFLEKLSGTKFGVADAFLLLLGGRGLAKGDLLKRPATESSMLSIKTANRVVKRISFPPHLPNSSYPNHPQLILFKTLLWNCLPFGMYPIKLIFFVLEMT